MKNKQKLRNSNQFKKKKNKAKNINKTSMLGEKFIKYPKNYTFPYHSKTENFDLFISKIEEYIYESDNIEYKKSVSDVQKNLSYHYYNNDKLEIYESILSISIRYYSEKFDLEFTPYEKGIQLFKIEVKPAYQKGGIGKNIMNKIIDIANELGIEISLIPIPIGNFLKMGKLREFYKNLGFSNDQKSSYWKYKIEKIEDINFQMAA